MSLCSDFKCSYTKSQIIAAKMELLGNVEKILELNNRFRGRMPNILGTVLKYIKVLPGLIKMCAMLRKIGISKHN